MNALIPPNALAAAPRWMNVEPRFSQLIHKIEPTANQHEDVQGKARGVIRCLNDRFWPDGVLPSHTTYLITGSWAKQTRVRLSSDIDIIFALPWAVAARYANRAGNRQSDILQEVKHCLSQTYWNTPIWADGPTIILDFSTYKIEVAPAFLDPSGPRSIYDFGFKVWLCETRDGGRYKLCAPTAEANQLHSLNQRLGGDVVALIRMAKVWKRCCNVPIKSFLLERLAIEFLSQWPHAGSNPGWYDWMLRDFLRFMLTRQHGIGTLPVTNEPYFYRDRWANRAATALANVHRACIFEDANLDAAAGAEWQKLFGSLIPKEAA